MQFEDYALRLNASDFPNRSKAKAKPQGRNFASSSVNTTPHTSIFHSELHAHAWPKAQVWVRTHSITSMLHAHCGRCV